MRWLSVLSDDASFDAALSRAVAELDGKLAGERPDLVIAFVSAAYAEHGDSLLRRLAPLSPRHVIGCGAGGVIGGGREIEQRPAVSLTAAVLPEVEVKPFHLESRGLPPLASAGFDRARFIVLADPFGFEAARFVRGMDERFPGGRVIGGLASGGHRPGESVLFLDGATHGSGAVGVALAGAIEIDFLVAQGCRPIGVPFFVTRSRENIIEELDGRPPYEVLKELFAALPGRDQELFRRSLFLGIVMRSAQEQYGQGDFLIRNILGIDGDNGALVVGALVEERRVVQFHLRDALTSSEDLAGALDRYAHAPSAGTAVGALMFSCLGRGQHLYGEPDHDSRLIRRHLGDLPIGGFFCNGEIGPVNGETFLHGYTSSIAIVRAPARV